MWDVQWGVLISHRGVEMALWAPLAPPWGPSRLPWGPRHKKSIFDKSEANKTPQLFCERLYRRNGTGQKRQNGIVNALIEEVERKKTQ